MSHITVITSYMIVACGLAEINSTRSDLVKAYRDFVTELLVLALDGAELMVDAGWMERIPQTVDRRELIH